MKNLLNFLLVFAAITVVGGISVFIYFKNNDVSKQVKKILVKEINKRLDGKISAKDLRLELKPSSLNIAVTGLRILDKSRTEVLSLNKLNAVLSTPNLLRFKVKFNSLSTDLLELRVIKDKKGEWNIYKIFKAKEKKGKMPEIDLLKIDNINIRVIDEIQNNQVLYENLTLNWEKEKRHKRFLVELSPSSQQLNKTGTSLSVNGLLNFSKDFHKDPDFFLNTELHNLPISHLEFFLATFLSYEEFQKIREAINKYSAAKAVLDGDIKINRIKDQLRINLRQDIGNFSGFKKTQVLADLNVSESIHINKLETSFDQEFFAISGDFKNWQSKNPDIDIKVKLTNNDLLNLVQNHFTFIDNENLKIILSKIEIINYNDLFNGEIGYSSDVKQKTLNLKLNLKQRIKKTFQVVDKLLTADLSFEGDNFKILNLSIPFNESALNVTGKINTKTKKFDIKIFTKDFAIEKFKRIFHGFNFFKEYQNYLSNSTLRGFTFIDLQITDSFLKGTAKITDGRFRKQDYPLSVNQLNADLQIDNNDLKIKQLNGFINGSFFSSNGEIEFPAAPAKPKIKLDFIAQKLDLSGILESGALDSFQFKKILPDSLYGELANIKLKITTPNQGDYNMEGRFDIKDLNFQINEDTPIISDVNGEVILSKTLISSKNLSANINGAEIKGMGAMDISGHIQSIDLLANNLLAKDLYYLSLFNVPKIKDFVIDPSGLLNIVLKYNPLGLEVDSTLKNVSLTSVHEKFSEPVQNLNGKLSFRNNKFTFEDLSLSSGASSGIFNGDIQNIGKGDFEPLFNLLFKGKLHSSLLNKYSPPAIRASLDYQGLVRSELALNGGPAKQVLDVKVFLDELKYCKFSTWLDLDKKILTKIKTKITITPSLISSNDAKVVFKQGTDKAKLFGRFQVKDYRIREKLNYEILVESPPETETVKNKLNLYSPHIATIKPFNLLFNNGNFLCDTYGSYLDRLSVCKFTLGPVTAKQFGIGDLYSKSSKIEFISVVDKPAEMQMRMTAGDWNGLPYSDLSFHLAVDEQFSRVRNLKARIKDGFVASNIDFNYLNFDSAFNINGNKLPAHEIAESVWKLGSEIPSGLLDVNFTGKTKGLLPDEIFFNLEGKADLIIKNGKLSQLSSMQRILSAINTVKSLDMNNIVHTLITFEGGRFDHLISSLTYNRGKVSTEKFLLKAPQIEMLAKGYVDYNQSKDFQDVRGQGVIPKYSKSFLQKLGVGEVNLGNLTSIANLNLGLRKSEKRFFKFKAKGKASDPDAIAQSIKESFAWL
jgi:hypothetical protein